MRGHDIVINKVFYSLFNTSTDVIPYSSYVPGVDDAEYRYLVQLVNKYFNHETSRKSYIDQEAELLQILPENNEQMEAFVNCICDEIQDMMMKNPEIAAGAGIFIWAQIDDQEYITFFKSALQSRFTVTASEDGKVSWHQNYSVLPGPSPKVSEYFYLNLNDNQAQVSDYECVINGDRSNYLAEYILKLNFKQSEAVTVKTINDTVVETIKNYYEEEAPKKIMEYKTIVADQVKEKGQIDNTELKEAVFADNETAQAVYQEVSLQQQIPQTPVYVSKKTERQLKKKQKLITDSGIELLIPLELLKDEKFFEYHHNDDGKISIVIKEIDFIENK